MLDPPLRARSITPGTRTPGIALAFGFRTKALSVQDARAPLWPAVEPEVPETARRRLQERVSERVRALDGPVLQLRFGRRERRLVFEVVFHADHVAAAVRFESERCRFRYQRWPAEPLRKTRGILPRAVDSVVSASRKAMEVDALIGATIKTVEELEGLVSMLGAFGAEEDDKPRRISLATELREIAALFDKLPMLENDLRVIKRRLRASLSTDPDKTPRAISIKDLRAVTVTEETRFEPVEEPRRPQTKPGLGIPLPKKDR